ncbi:MAG: glutamine--fructose-6-phosphate transaminase (isomerizing) [Bacillota bacterium]
MCGIVGYVGDGEALGFILEGLKRLEYRGYDSAGVAVLQGNRSVVRKSAGRICSLEKGISGESLEGTLGIGHTRWATHGAPTDLNAHPHTDCHGDVVVVHNGIIENYQELTAWLRDRGHMFTSETDTEVIPHLVEEYYSEGQDLASAVRQAALRLRGSYALAVMASSEPGYLVAVRQSSPLVVGLGEDENYIASDIPALLGRTRRTYILEDGEMAVVARDGVTVCDLKGAPTDKPVFQVEWDPVMAEKGGYAHFMLKEIHEQPVALRDTLAGRLDGGRVVLKEVSQSSEALRESQRVFIVACGTAYHAGLVGKHLVETLARVPVEVDLASEFRYRDPLVLPGSVMVIVSQSGETADTLAALREGKARGARVIGITNVVGSSVARESDEVIYTRAGPEIAVASTKAYTTQIAALALLATRIAELKGRAIPAGFMEALNALPVAAERAIALDDRVKEVAKRISQWDDVFFVGRGPDFASSLEGQLKLKEISYIHAEAYAAGELKHGTLALIIDGVPVVALATQRTVFDKTLSNVMEIKARGGWVVGVVNEGDRGMHGVCDLLLEVPETHPLLAPVITAIPLQLLAYHAAVLRGCDVDRPRNLAKSVTVE